MIKHTLVILTAIALFLGGQTQAPLAKSKLDATNSNAASSAQKGDELKTNPKGRYASVNGLKLYYEIHGSGEPLVLLHGGVGGIEMFAPVLPELAKRHQVIAIDLQGHGRTADIDRPMRYELMADDVAALLKHLDIKQADLMGYSLGAGVAMRTAIQHPAAEGRSAH